MKKTHAKLSNLRQLYPHLSEEQLSEAEENLEKYLQLVIRIYARIEENPQLAALFRLLIEERRKGQEPSA